MNLDQNKIQEPKEEEQAAPDQRDEQIAALGQELAAQRDQMLRTIAEAQNIQKRMREQHADALKYAAQPLVKSLLPVLDNLERSLASLETGASPEKVVEGVRAIEKQLRQALAHAKVERIASVGRPFNPEVHEAVTTVVSEEHPENTVVAEIEPGYTMSGRVVRPARVQVSKKP